MRRHEAGLGAGERRLQGRLGRMEAPGHFQEHRHMAMHAPFAAGSSGAQRREGRREIDMARDRAVAALHDLVQIDAVVERRERALGLGADRRQAQRGAELQLGDADAGRGESREGVGRVLELHRAVADVVADADMAPQRVVRPCARERPVACATIAALASACRWSRKNATVSSMVSRKQQGSGSSASTISRPVRRSSATRCATCRAIVSAIARGASGRCAATALKVPGTVETEPIMPSGSSRGQDLGGLVRVGQPLGREPVGLVDVLLHARAVKRAVGKGIDGEDVEAVAAQAARAAPRTPRAGSAPAPRPPTAAGRARAAHPATPRP